MRNPALDKQKFAGRENFHRMDNREESIEDGPALYPTAHRFGRLIHRSFRRWRCLRVHPV